MSSKRQLITVPVASTSFTTEAYFDGKGVYPAIRFGYRREGIEQLGHIQFSRVLAMRKRAERCCKVWHVEGAYDTLVEVEDSPWVAEMRADTNERWRNEWGMHYYLIYLDSVGCFEVIAESWSASFDHH